MFEVTRMDAELAFASPYIRLGIALLLGAIIAYSVVGLSVMKPLAAVLPVSDVFVSGLAWGHLRPVG